MQDVEVRRALLLLAVVQSMKALHLLHSTFDRRKALFRRLSALYDKGTVVRVGQHRVRLNFTKIPSHRGEAGLLACHLGQLGVLDKDRVPSAARL